MAGYDVELGHAESVAGAEDRRAEHAPLVGREIEDAVAVGDLLGDGFAGGFG